MSDCQCSRGRSDGGTRGSLVALAHIAPHSTQSTRGVGQGLDHTGSEQECVKGGRSTGRRSRRQVHHGTSQARGKKGTMQLP